MRTSEEALTVWTMDDIRFNSRGIVYSFTRAQVELLVESIRTHTDLMIMTTKTKATMASSIFGKKFFKGLMASNYRSLLEMTTAIFCLFKTRRDFEDYVLLGKWN